MYVCMYVSISITNIYFHLWFIQILERILTIFMNDIANVMNSACGHIYTMAQLLLAVYAVNSFGGARHKFHCSSEISLAICTLCVPRNSQVPL